LPEQPRRRDGLSIIGFLLEKARLASRMKNATSERSVINGAALRQASKAGPNLLSSPVDLISGQAANRADLGPNGFVIEFRGVQVATNTAEHS
jgi:hypothetical protein